MSWRLAGLRLRQMWLQRPICWHRREPCRHDLATTSECLAAISCQISGSFLGGNYYWEIASCQLLLQDSVDVITNDICYFSAFSNFVLNTYFSWQKKCTSVEKNVHVGVMFFKVIKNDGTFVLVRKHYSMLRAWFWKPGICSTKAI